jgi:amidase
MHMGMFGFDGGAIGADIYCDCSVIHARGIADCAGRSRRRPA